MSELGRMTSPETARSAPGSLLVVPVGSTEQHGPHLPLSTDTAVAVALAHRLAGRRSGTVVAPALAYGASGEHAPFAGTLSIGQEALEVVLVELGRSADAFAAVLYLSGHGGNAAPLARAVARLAAEGRTVRSWSPGPTGDPRDDAHAGWTETSVMLALAPGTVHVDRAEAGTQMPLGELAGALRSGGVSAVSPNGVLGDPAGARAEDGEAILDGWTDALIAALGDWPIVAAPGDRADTVAAPGDRANIVAPPGDRAAGR